MRNEEAYRSHIYILNPLTIIIKLESNHRKVSVILKNFAYTLIKRSVNGVKNSIILPTGTHSFIYFVVIMKLLNVVKKREC